MRIQTTEQPVSLDDKNLFQFDIMLSLSRTGAHYKRLTELGYGVWLDKYQMGGSDSLFAKIDAGIQNAYCVIACVTPKYILSTHCRWEMSLADSLEKPIALSLLE
jgi:hypothetical protein